MNDTTALRSLGPGWFALVMATGIVSTAAARQDQASISVATMLIAVLAYLVPAVLSLLRLRSSPALFRAELSTPSQSFAFFAVVAGSAVLGERLYEQHVEAVGLALLAVAALGWLVLGYAIPTLVIFTPAETGLTTADGTWLLWIVATQGISTATVMVAPSAGALARGGGRGDVGGRPSPSPEACIDCGACESRPAAARRACWRPGRRRARWRRTRRHGAWLPGSGRGPLAVDPGRCTGVEYGYASFLARSGQRLSRCQRRIAAGIIASQARRRRDSESVDRSVVEDGIRASVEPVAAIEVAGDGVRECADAHRQGEHVGQTAPHGSR
ncbi:SLAC1 family transporter [Pseudonocardia adelaidensis]|uniref:Uncharacterized protein n=1 Tax=Pseudonocardia adelaidensis TaxID=648754 RepID=A0ABP9NJ44_9PSEU